MSLLMPDPCTLLPPIPWEDTGNDGQVCTTGLVGRVGACELHSLCLEGHWVHLQHATLSPVSTVNSLHNFRLVYFCFKKSLCCHSKTALFAMNPNSVIFLLLAFLQNQGTLMNVLQSTNFPPCLSRLLVLKGWPVDL